MDEQYNTLEVDVNKYAEQYLKDNNIQYKIRDGVYTIKQTKKGEN